MMNKLLVVGSLFVLVLLIGCAREAPVEEAVENGAAAIGDELQDLDELDELANELDEDAIANELDELEKLGLE